MSMSIDLSELRSSTYHRFTSYTNSFFLLRVPLMINEQLSAIGCSEGMLTLNSRYPSLRITFDSLFKDVNTVVKKYGISELTNYWIEDVPLFELKYSTPDGMKKFIRSAKMVQNEIASRISARLAVASGFTASHQHSRLPVVVYTEVFLITPDPAGKDADLKLVTSETLSNCIAMHKKSEVFNFGALFRGFKMKGAPTSHQLLEDLNEIVEWYQLGIQLGIPEAELNNIRHRNDEVKGRRCEMLSTWLAKSPQPTWATIINALTGIGRRNLGNKMALKYGVPVTTSTKTKQASKQVPKHAPTAQKKGVRDSIQQKLSSQVQQLQSDIELKDMELVVSKQTATEARDARDITRGRLDEVGKKAVEVQTNVVLLSKKSSDTRSQLEQKRQNLEDLKKRVLWKKEEFQGVVDYTNEEIRTLQEKLAAIQAELASEKEEARSLPEQLQQAKKELAEKSVRVRELELTQQKLETSLENQRERVDQLLMQESVASDLQQHNMEIKLLTEKKELEAKTAEVASLKETVAYQDGKVKRLSAEVLSREVLLQSLLTQFSQATKPDHTQELKSNEELQRLTEEVSELRAKLFRTEDAKQEAQRQMDAAELKSMLLQEIVREYKEIVREYRQTPPPIPPRRVRKPASELPGPGKDTWEYKVFSGNSAEIVDKLVNVRLADRVASKLSAASIIGESVTEHVYKYGPGITERSRLQHIVTALKDKIQLDGRRYHEFRNVLLSLGADTEAAIYYMPETDPTVQKSTAMKARTPSKDQDPTVQKSTAMKARTPSKDQVGGVDVISGMDVIGETTLSVTNAEQTFHWADYGLKLHIPPASLPAGVEQSSIVVKASLSGPLKFPEDTTLVSAVYYLQSTVEFSQPIAIQIQHCGIPSDDLSLTFARASLKEPPYTFTALDGGLFPSNSFYACIQLDQFSLITIIRKLWKSLSSREPERLYCAHVYYTKESVNTWIARFVVTHNLVAYVTAVRKMYSEAVAGPDLDVIFEGEEIVLDIPREGVTVNNNWTITPLAYPKIAKRLVDTIECDGRLPSCQLLIKWREKGTPDDLEYRVVLKGAKEPSDFFLIALKCEITTKGTPGVPGQESGHSKLVRKKDTIIKQIAGQRFTRDLAEKLLGAKMIGSTTYYQAKNYATGVVEVDRATALFNAVVAGVELNPAKYGDFIRILKQIQGSDDLVAFINR